MAKLKKPYSIEDFLPSIKVDIQDAVDFLITEFEDDFEKADRYFNGEVDLPAETGRSKVVSTQVRDSIRNLRPSILRVLTSNRRKLIKYVPSNVQIAAVVEQQEAFVHQLFWASNGYQLIYDATDESMKHRFGPVKTYWEANPAPEFVRITQLTLDEAQFLSEMPDVRILDLIPTSRDEEETADDTEMEEKLEFYDVECERQMTNGRIVMEAVPYGEFFISRNARSVNDARIHGHRRSVTVSEAVEMGLEYDDWADLDDLDPEQDEVAGQATERRGYRKEPEPDRGDILGHRFLLTEAYVRLDLEGNDTEQLYRVSLGGTGYELLDCEREAESPWDVICHDPKAFTVIGSNIADVTMDQQDVLTSLLRGMVDNVHMANNPRMAGNPSQVNFDDLMMWDIGAPIRMKGQGTTIQVVQIPSQIQSTMPMLQYLEQDAQNKVGITKAAQGLDPNAMQSTDKDAVQNTIQLSQGQVELCVRNIIETGIVSIFRKLLKLSIQHQDRIQMVQMRGFVLPVDQLLFDPNLKAEPQVGLGTVTDEQRMMGLQMTLQTQMGVIQQFGVANPFVTLSHIYNTMEDLTKEFGLYNVSRYYNVVTPEVEAQFAEQQRQQMAAAKAAEKGQMMDPAVALVETEKIKAGTDKLKLIVQARSKALELQLKAIESDAQDDLARDKMAQERAINSAKILGDTGIKLDQNAISREQAAPRTPAAQNAVSATSAAAESAPADGPASAGATPTDRVEA